MSGRTRRVPAATAVGTALLLLGAGLAACQPPPNAAASITATAPAGLTFETVLKSTSDAIAEGEAMLRKAPADSATLPLELVRLYGERARLTGDYEDYARAEQLLAGLPAPSQAAGDVCLARAKLQYSLHRLAAAKAILDGCPAIAGTVDDLGLRADIAFYSGRYKDAGLIYRALVNQAGTSQSYVRMAMYAGRTGAPGEAMALLEAAEKRYHGGSPLMLSWFALQRGLIELDRGRYDEARAHYTLADQRMPGYWLNEEHLAEIAELRGDTAAAKQLYEKVVAKTDAPEFLDALAALEAEAGDPARARQLLDRAGATYEARAKRFPEAVAGHALDHYLSEAPQPARALALAEANYRNRPFGEAAVGLAKAYLLNRRPREAARLLEQQLSQGWDTAEAWWILSVAAQASGDGARARSAAAEATRRNPRSPTQYAFEP